MNRHFLILSLISVILDMTAGTLAFVADGEYLGVAFTGLKGTLYPTVSISENRVNRITMRYIGCRPPASPPSLMAMSRHALRPSIGYNMMLWGKSYNSFSHSSVDFTLLEKIHRGYRKDLVASLELPQLMKTYLLLGTK